MTTPESRPPVRVLIVDDHPVVRAGLATLLRKEAGLKVTGSAHSAEEALEILKRSLVDVMLLDIRMPSISGIDLLNLLNGVESPPLAAESNALPSGRKR